VPQSPSFNKSATGLFKETTFGVPGTPSIWVSAQDITMTPTNNFMNRSGARNQTGMERGLAGPYGGSGTFTIESDPDVIGAPLAWAMGTESVTLNATAGNPAAGASVNTGLSAAVTFGSTTIPVTSATNIVAGMGLVIDALGRAPEVGIVASVSGTTVTLTAALVYSHPTGAIVQALTAYDHTLLLGIPRPTFSVQFQNQTNCITHSGNKVADWAITLDPRALVALRFTTTYASDGIIAPGTPAYSPLAPYKVLDPGNTLLVNGAPAPAGILTLALTVATGLQPSEYTLGQGRFITSIPEGQTRVTGTMTLQFTSSVMRQLFWGNIGATGPQGEVIPCSLVFNMLSPSYINGVVRYGMKITLPSVQFTTDTVPGRAGGVLTENVSFMCSQSTPGANDDCQIVVSNASSLAA